MVEGIVLGLLTLWAGWAFRQARKNKGGCGSCSGSCHNCPHACNRKTELP